MRMNGKPSVHSQILAQIPLNIGKCTCFLNDKTNVVLY